MIEQARTAADGAETEQGGAAAIRRGPHHSSLCVIAEPTAVLHRPPPRALTPPELPTTPRPFVAVRIIKPPVKDKRGRRRYETTRKEGPHQLRHFYASIMLGENGVSISALASYLGHDPAVTLRFYGHLQVGDDDKARKAMDAAMFRPRPIASGTTEG